MNENLDLTKILKGCPKGTEPEGICCNPHTATDYVYGHDYCEQYDEKK